MTGHIDRLTPKGYGFIRTDDGQRVWFHARAVRVKQFDALVVGEKVEVEYEKDDLGRLQAATVTVQ